MHVLYNACLTGAPGDKEAGQRFWIGNDDDPCQDCGDGGGLEEPAGSKQLLKKATKGGQHQWGVVFQCCWKLMKTLHAFSWSLMKRQAAKSLCVFAT